VEDRLLEIMDRFGRQRLLLVGDFMLDEYLYGDAERISAEAPVPVLRIVDRQQRLGGAGSVAACLAALRAQYVAAAGVIGADEAGQRLVRMLRQEGIETAGLIEVDGRPTITKTRVVGLAQHRHRQQLMRLDEEENRPLPPQPRQAFMEKLQGLLDSGPFDAILVEDYDKGLIDAALVQYLIERGRKTGAAVLVDPAAIEDFGRYAGATVITPNRNEFAAATGRRYSDLDDLAAQAERLRKQYDFGWVVITLDKEGAFLVGPETARRIPAYPRDVYDNTGAGDAVLAMLGAAMAAGADVAEAVHLANVAGGLEVEKFGSAPVRWSEVVTDLLAQRRRQGQKLFEIEPLMAELQRHREAGRRIVFTNGCFDLLHLGHVDLLRFCKQHGDVLVVGLNSDESVRMNKGPDRPILNQRERASMLEAIECVDYVTIFETVDPSKLIERIRPDVLVKGADRADWVCGREFVESYGGKVLLAPLRKGYSTTNLIQKVGLKANQQAPRQDSESSAQEDPSNA